MRSAILILTSFMVVTSCATPGETDDGTGTDDTGGGGEQPGKSLHPVPADPKPGPCDMVAPYGKGGLQIELPVPCDPYWIDRGDPPPDTQGLGDEATRARIEEPRATPE